VQVVNLLVTPAEAEILNLATQQNIQLVLRNPADREIVTTPGASTINLFTDGKARPPRIVAAAPRRTPVSPPTAPVAAPEKPRTITIEVYQGPKKIESTFKNLDPSPVAEARP
jgi:proline-rich tail region repeat protein